MTEFTNPNTGSYLTPRLEHALVSDAMRHGVFSCASDTDLRAAARTMALHHVHSLVVSSPGDNGHWRVLSDSDLLRAILDAPDAEQTVGDVAVREFPTVTSDEHLAKAAAMMRDRGYSHLLVLDPRDGHPAGMLSTLDVAGLVAWGEA